MAPSPQTSGTSTTFSNQTSKVASLDRSTITWLVVLACILIVAFVIVACLLCKCRSNRKNARVSRGYSIHDGRNEFHAWNRHASPTHTVPPPAYGGYGDVKSKVDQQTSITVPPQAAMKASVAIEPMVVEEAGSDEGRYTRSNKKTSRYYGGFSARLSRMSQIGRAM
jgi:hypothetical protein